MTAEQEQKADVEQEPALDEDVETTGEDTGAPAVPDELAQLRTELADVEAEAAEYLDGWQRARAEFANYKRRQEAERARLTALTNVSLLRKLLPILDDLNRALAEMPPSVRELPWSAGLTMVKRKFDTFLRGEGVVAMETEGQMFDPTYHEAITHEDAEGYEEGQIIGEVQRGYTLGERVLRPASVRVAKAPAVAEEAQEHATEHTDNTADDKE